MKKLILSIIYLIFLSNCLLFGYFDDKIIKDIDIEYPDGWTFTAELTSHWNEDVLIFDFDHTVSEILLTSYEIKGNVYNIITSSGFSE